MAKIINSYPILQDAHLNKIEKETEYSLFYYDSHHHLSDLVTAKNDDIVKGKNLYTISSPENNWHPEHNETLLNVKVDLKNTDCLFDENSGLTYEDSTLGLAVRWTDKISQVRGIFPLDVDIEKGKECHKSQKVIFLRQLIRGILDIDLILYLKRNGAMASSGVYSFCTTVGTVLGSLDSISYIVAGEGAIFPITEAINPNSPLWSVYWNTEVNPEEDEFTSENVSLVINKKHKLAKQYCLDEGMASPFMKEILAAFFVILITQTHSKMQAIDANGILYKTDYPQGTIANYVRYLIDKMFDVADYLQSGNIAEMTKIIRDCIFEGKMEGGEQK